MGVGGIFLAVQYLYDASTGFPVISYLRAPVTCVICCCGLCVLDRKQERVIVESVMLSKKAVQDGVEVTQEQCYPFSCSSCSCTTTLCSHTSSD